MRRMYVVDEAMRRPTAKKRMGNCKKRRVHVEVAVGVAANDLKKMHYKLSDVMPVHCQSILRWLNQCSRAMWMNVEVVVVAVVVLSQK